MNDTISANQVRAANNVGIPVDGQQYVNLVNFVREEYENEMERATHFVIKVSDSAIGNIIRGIVNYLHECQLAERNESERGQGEENPVMTCLSCQATTDKVEPYPACGQCGAMLIAPTQRTPSPTEAPREDFPVPTKKPQGACDYRKPECTSAGVTIGDKWYCMNHLPECDTAPQPQAGDVIAQVGFRWKVRDGSLWQRAEDGHWFEHASGQLARDIAEEAEAAIKAARNLGLEVRG